MKRTFIRALDRIPQIEGFSVVAVIIGEEYAVIDGGAHEQALHDEHKYSRDDKGTEGNEHNCTIYSQVLQEILDIKDGRV